MRGRDDRVRPRLEPPGGKGRLDAHPDVIAATVAGDGLGNRIRTLQAIRAGCPVE
ncbi:hypothetical protein TPA0905_34390 [Streptomyces olivaceus]|nr:hypothetical protein TPA0905_34390 [Streptomyces olivaceus]